MRQKSYLASELGSVEMAASIGLRTNLGTSLGTSPVYKKVDEKKMEKP